MSSNREKLKNRGGPAFENDHKRFNPMQQERILTHMNTIGSKEEMRRLDASRRDPESGMMDTL